MPTDGTVSGLLFVLIMAATILAIAQIFWFRAGSARELGDSPFTAIPVVSILFRTLGEVYATLALAIGVGGCLFIWVARGNPFWLVRESVGILPSVPVESSFLGGLIFLLSMSVASFLMLVLAYFLAESVVVMVDVASHVRMLVRQGDHAEPQVV